MPIYEFQEPETGQVFEVFRPVEDRDKPLLLRRKGVPSRLGVVCGGTPSPTMEDKLLKAYHTVECEQGSRFRSGFNKSTIKKAHEAK